MLSDNLCLCPTLNRGKIFECTPPPSININGLSLPKDWLAQLEKQCRKVNENLQRHCFNRHINKAGTSSILTKQLQIIYCCLKGNVDTSWGHLSESDHHAIISKLIEGVELCSDGFHNRVNDVVDSLQKPRFLSQLLYQVRVSSVKKAASTLTGEVHAWNQVTKIAAKNGLGIRANFSNDRCYSVHLSNKEVIQALQKEFEEEYVPFNLPFLLAKQLHGLLSELGYRGPLEDGYTTGIAEKIGDRIKCYLDAEIAERINWKDCFIIDEDEDNDFINASIKDLNWELIRKWLFISLDRAGYFFRTPSQTDIRNILDCAYFSNLFSTYNSLLGIEETYITSFFNENDHLQLNRFEKIKKCLPSYWNKLIDHKKFITEIQLLTDNLKKISIDNIDFYKKFNLLCTFDLTHLDKDQNIFISLVELIKNLMKKDTDGWHVLMSTERYSPETIKKTLEFISKHIDQFDQKTLMQMFLSKNKNDENMLMSAARYHIEAVKPILEFMSRHKDLFDEKILERMFSDKVMNNWNLLMSAANYHPEAVKLILEFISKRKDLFDKKILIQMFSDKVMGGWNVLTSAIQFQPESVKPILEFMSQHKDLFDEKILERMFSDKVMNGWSALILAEHYHPEAVESILELISQHIDQFDQKTLMQMFSDEYVFSYNILISATRSHPEIVKKILEFISQHIDQFDQKKLTQMFLSKNDNGWNALMSAAHYQPEVMNLILELISQYIKPFNQKTLIQMFLDKTNDGWNALMSAACHPPEVMGSILGFISKHIDPFNQKTLVQMFLDKVMDGWHTLMLEEHYHHEAGKSILEFISQHIDLKTMMQMLLMKKPEAHAWNAFIVEECLKKYLADLYIRNEQNITHTTRFFRQNFGYSTQEKITAALKFKATLEEGSNQINNLSILAKSYPALGNGRLGQIFKAYYQLAPNEALDEVTNSAPPLLVTRQHLILG